MKLYNFAGHSTFQGQRKFRVAGDMSRARIMEREGHVEIDLKPLPRPMTREQAQDYISGLMNFTPTTNRIETMSEMIAFTPKVTETDEQIIERMRKNFEIVERMTSAVKAGEVRAMIISGPPGVGKSFGVERVLGKTDLFANLAQQKPKYEIVKGAMSALGLYAKLFQYSDRGNVLVFDDCDSILLDDLSLNILKAALDSSKKRTISWNTDSRLLRSEGIPDTFEFKAGAIFITNIKFQNVRSKKLQDHLAALESRCHYVDLSIDTNHEKILRIRQIVGDGMLDSYNMEQSAKDEVIDFIVDNQHRLRELSLRMVIKLADLRKSFSDSWRDVAHVTCMLK